MENENMENRLMSAFYIIITWIAYNYIGFEFALITILVIIMTILVGIMTILSIKH